MSANFHPLVYLIDYVMGVIMWTLIGRVAMNIFQREDSNFFFMKAFVKFTNPLLRIFRPVTPSFIIQPLVPLYVAWFFFMIRFYLMPWILVIDYILGIIMWTLIGRSAMNIFQREDSNFFFMKAFVKFTNPIIKLFRFITPSFIIPLFVPLYVAWFFYMFRFYAMPYILGYDVMGMLSFPLESDIAKEIYRLFNR